MGRAPERAPGPPGWVLPCLGRAPEEKMEREIDERLLARIWRGQWIEPSRLETADGRRLQVVFPGRANGDSGPDFQGAIVALEEGRLLEGDVELHVWSRDWITHGHQRDPAYNGVVLHVTWMADTLWTRREDGVEVATVPLKGHLSLPVGALVALDPSPEEPPPFYTGCRRVAQALGRDGTGRLLDLVGETRSKTRVSAFRGSWPAGHRGRCCTRGCWERRASCPLRAQGRPGGLGPRM